MGARHTCYGADHHIPPPVVLCRINLVLCSPSLPFGLGKTPTQCGLGKTPTQCYLVCWIISSVHSVGSHRSRPAMCAEC